MTAQNFLAFDFGAESGRAVSGAFDGRSLRLHEVHRFPNRAVRAARHLYWDALRLLDEIQTGLERTVQECGEVASLGIDTWGVDFGLLDGSGALIGNPIHYRDARTDGMLEEAFRRSPRERIFQLTGIQFLQLNTLYQLLAMELEHSPALDIAHTLLMMPDLFNYWLTGERVSEFTIATTTQFYDPAARDWARSLLDELHIRHTFLPRIVPPATELGKLTPHLARHRGLEQTRVIAPACHDTGSAVAAVPTRVADYAYISSGTWSLMGTEVKAPVINARALEYNFTNEGGAGNTFRLLKNITGLWLLQECRRVWAREGAELSYGDLMASAAGAEPFAAFVNPDDPSFLHPEDMPAAVAEFCQRTGQTPPPDRRAMVRCLLESLALAYRRTLDQLEALLGKRVEVIHIVGGGSQNQLLSQFTADACARPVLAGPVEATALGNIILQMVSQRIFASIEQARAVVRESFAFKAYEPQDASAWTDAYARFLDVARQA